MAVSKTYQISREEIRRYRGQYVAVMNRKVVASGKNLYKKIEELEQIIKDEDLNSKETYAFVENAFRDGGIATKGTAITKVIPHMSRFPPDGKRTKKLENVIEKLTMFFEKYFDIELYYQSKN